MARAWRPSASASSSLIEKRRRSPSATSRLTTERPARLSSAKTSFVAFDVTYADGTKSSNRRVPAAALGGLDGDGPARGIIEAQDRDITAASGRPRPAIRSIARSPVPEAEKTPLKAKRPAKTRR